MVSREKYKKTIDTFIKKYGKVMDQETLNAVTELWRWVNAYENNMKADIDVENRKLYVKRGANLLNRFVESYNIVSRDLQESLVKCRLAILRGDTKTCNEKTKKDLQNLIKEYNSFVQAMIGCTNASGDYILSLLRRTSDILGPEYFKLKENLELRCLTLEKERMEDL